MKSALELAMEKTAGKEPKLTADQKKEIEEIRSVAKAKAAEEEIMAAGQMGRAASPEAAKDIKEKSAARIRKIMADAEAKAEKVKSRKES